PPAPGTDLGAGVLDRNAVGARSGERDPVAAHSGSEAAEEVLEPQENGREVSLAHPECGGQYDDEGVNRKEGVSPGVLVERARAPYGHEQPETIRTNRRAAARDDRREPQRRDLRSVRTQRPPLEARGTAPLALKSPALHPSGGDAAEVGQRAALRSAPRPPAPSIPTVSPYFLQD